MRLDKVGRVERSAASLALVAVGMVASAVRACAYDISVGEELVSLFVVVLHRRLLDKLTLVVEFAEEVACHLRMYFARGS